MTALLILLLQTAACIGFGAFSLRLAGVSKFLLWSERLAWSFILGMGLLGWLVFFVGILGAFTTGPLVGTLGLGICGLYFLGRPISIDAIHLSLIERLLISLLALVAVLDCFEGIAPPADGDSLAYHFNLPKEFLRDQKITFVARAIDGAVPLLIQMTYVPVMGLGGEKALTLWTMISSWGVAYFLFVLCQRHLGRTWSLALTLIWMTTPAVLYGGGSGQVEVRIAGFVLLTIAALMRAKETGLARYVVIAGLAAGMFVGAKYTGLMFAAACGFYLLLLRQWPKQMVVFGVTSVALGFQWYFWNWLHTGDPLFPVLFDLIGPDTYGFWNAEHHVFFKIRHFAAETHLPNTPLWMVLYPFISTFATSPKFDSERVGLGPLLLMLFPMIAYGVWKMRAKIPASPWLGPAIVLLVFYSVWYLTGSSQRVRHLLPVYPVLLLLCGVVIRKIDDDRRVRVPVLVAGFLTIGLQVAANGASSLNYLRYVIPGESRDAFLSRNVSGYAAVEWINRNLKPTDRVLVADRQLLYLLNTQTYFGHNFAQIEIDLLSTQTDPERFYRELREQKITHILSLPEPRQGHPATAAAAGYGLWRPLLKIKCLKIIGNTDFRFVRSRSLTPPAASDRQHLILELDTATCPII